VVDGNVHDEEGEDDKERAQDDEEMNVKGGRKVLASEDDGIPRGDSNAQQHICATEEKQQNKQENKQNTILSMGPPNEADTAILGKPILATVRFETKSIFFFFNSSKHFWTLFLFFTANAVAPGKNSDAKESGINAHDGAEGFDDADELARKHVDPHDRDEESEDRDKDSILGRALVHGREPGDHGKDETNH